MNTRPTSLARLVETSISIQPGLDRRLPYRTAMALTLRALARPRMLPT